MVENSFIVPTYTLQFPNTNEILAFCKPIEVSELIKIKDEDSKELLKIIQTLKNMLEKERENNNRTIEKIKIDYEELALKLESKHQKAIEENKKYHEWYGTLVSPILIIKELWNNGTIGELDKLVPPNRWRVGNGLNGEGGKTAKRYWLAQLEEWGLIKTWGKGFYMANVGMYEALEILNKMMKKQKIIKTEKGE